MNLLRAVPFLVAASGCSAFATTGGPPNAVGRRACSAAAAFAPRGGSAATAAGAGEALCAAAGGAAAADTALPPAVEGVVSSANWSLLSERGRAALLGVAEFDAGTGAQEHVYGGWPDAGTDDEGKARLGEQLADLDGSYPGGLAAYLAKAKALLKESADGTNPFSDFEASVPSGESLEFGGASGAEGGGMSFAEAEEAGLGGIDSVAFVLVAGGLGERLGYSGIKLSLETNLVTNRSYLALYADYILAMQRRAQLSKGDDSVRLPLVIMTSGDTDAATRKLLEDSGHFGMDPDQVSIVCQDKVPALKDSAAGLSLSGSDRWTVETKPHGHGDVHHLLLREGHIGRWEEAGMKHVVFLQDTNALIINSILPALGVSIAKGFHMNSITIPRLAGEAAGAITRLE